jgi:hypothetical protein
MPTPMLKGRGHASWPAARHFPSPEQRLGVVRPRLFDAVKTATSERGTTSRADAAENSAIRKVLALASEIENMGSDALRERYHELIDKRPMSSIERFELDRIKARLDREDFDAEQDARDRDWERRRTEVLDSIEGLLDRLRQSGI